MNPKQIANFLSKIKNDPKTGCWLWDSSMTNGGYGLFWLNGKYVGAHVASYEHFVGPLEDLNCLHKCGVRRCVNPQHLRKGTQSENIVEASETGKLSRRKLTDEQVRNVKRRLLIGEKLTPIAKSLGVSTSAIWYIREEKSFKRITI